MFTEEDKPGASAAARITRIWTGGTSPNAAIAQTNTPTAAPTWVCASHAKLTMLRATSARKPMIVFSIERSASLPPRGRMTEPMPAPRKAQVKAISPRPKTVLSRVGKAAE